MVGRGRIWVCLLGMAAALAVGTPAKGASADSDPAFCQPTVVRDFLARFDLFFIREARPRADGSLHFGPSSIRIASLPSLLVGDGKVGYRLFLEPGAKPAHPRWRISATLTRIHWGKRLFVAIDGTSRKVRTVAPGQSTGASFEVPTEPAYYLVSVTFRSLAGRRLGYYRFYFRVVHPIDDGRLALNAAAYHRGETVLGHVENFGTVPVSFGAGVTIERPEGAGWVPAAETPRGPVPAIAYVVGAGMSADRCSAFSIPPTMPPGRYRMTVATGLDAEFDVLP